MLRPRRCLLYTAARSGRLSCNAHRLAALLIVMPSARRSLRMRVVSADPKMSARAATAGGRVSAGGSTSSPNSRSSRANAMRPSRSIATSGRAFG